MCQPYSTTHQRIYILHPTPNDRVFAQGRQGLMVELKIYLIPIILNKQEHIGSEDVVPSGAASST
jgi:hypothetical protein